MKNLTLTILFLLIAYTASGQNCEYHPDYSKYDYVDSIYLNSINDWVVAYIEDTSYSWMHECENSISTGLFQEIRNLRNEIELCKERERISELSHIDLHAEYYNWCKTSHPVIGTRYFTDTSYCICWEPFLHDCLCEGYTDSIPIYDTETPITPTFPGFVEWCATKN